MNDQFETLAWVKRSPDNIDEVWGFTMEDAKRLASRMVTESRELVLRSEDGQLMLVRVHKSAE